ncbi:MATE family efflux transporter [Rhodobacteraceae bacterium DSL-40]|uniref:MATE family efflux transporter n=1 Tax=Amaricoccus sp. B4 TaxID=3368557 RepID=UPI000DAEC198
MPEPARNPFLRGALPAIFARTALPIIFVMGMNGLLTVVDALFLGHFAGEAALAAVTLIFPLYMLIVALATLVASGMASILARLLGAGRRDAAREIFARAHWLALAAGVALIALHALLGGALVVRVAGADPALAAPAALYLRILVLFAPLQFLLAVNSDALRSEGRAGFMAAASLLVSLGNIAFDYLLIARLDLGVAGSAFGTVLAQALALGIILAARARGGMALGLPALRRNATLAGSGGMLALGAPQSLGFLGIALVSSAILLRLQTLALPDYPATVAAYGIVTRVLTFAFLPLLGLSQAMQSIVGNNHGAGLAERVRGAVRLALGCAFVYGAAVEALAMGFAAPIGGLFVADPRVIAEVAAILPVMVTLYVLTGPHMMVAAWFQALGDAPRAALLGLAKPYLFTLPLIVLLPHLLGPRAIWWAMPGAEALLALLTLAVLWRAIRARNPARARAVRP